MNHCSDTQTAQLLIASARQVLPGQNICPDRPYKLYLAVTRNHAMDFAIENNKQD